MCRRPNRMLLAGAALSAPAALAHLGCIAFGPAWYRFFGAGEPMAQRAANGDWYPAVVTLGVATVLFAWSAFALSGAGLIRRLPFLRLALVAITAAYLLRAVAAPALVPYFPDNSTAFWWWSSAICLVFGAVHLVGLQQVWSRL